MPESPEPRPPPTVTAPAASSADIGADTLSAIEVIIGSQGDDTITGSAGVTGSISNVATVAAPAGVTDPTPGNNSATDTDVPGTADLSITKTDGTMLYQRRNIVQQRVTEDADYLLQYAMQQSTRSGTSKTLANQFAGIRFAGKTGTSSDHKDSWFTGFEHESSVTVWLGRDDNKPIGLTGGSGALTLFSQYFRIVPPNSLFRAIPPDITLGRFSAATGRAVADDCEGTLLLPKVVSATLLTDCE